MNALAEWMKAAGKTDAALAADLHVSHVTVWRIRTGKNLPSYELASHLNEVTKGAVSADDFMPLRDAAQ